MSIKFADLSKETRSTSIDVDGQPLALVYKPKALSAKAQILGGRLVKLAEDSKNGLAVDAKEVFGAIEDLVGVLADLLVSWDLTDESGEKLPASREWIERLPMEMLADIFRVVSEGQGPNETSAGA